MRSLIVLFLVSLPLAAQQTNNEFAVSYGRSYFTEDVADNSYANTVGLTYNRFWTPAVSTRFGVTEIGAEIPGGLGSSGEIETSAWTASVEYHLLRDARLSPWAGIGAAYVQTEIGSRRFDASPPHEFTALLTAGADLHLTRFLSLGGDVAYMPYKPDVGPAGEIDVSPVTASGNLKFRW